MARTSTRDRLVAAADRCLLRDGAARTSLADVAREAEVPLGNLYYWFRTREALVAAVIERRAEQLRAGLAAIDAAHPEPDARIRAWLEGYRTGCDDIVRWGCPIGSLVDDVLREGGHLPERLRAYVGALLDWLETRFAELGAPDPEDRARALFEQVQGAIVAARGVGRPEDLARAIDRLASRPAG
jgi:AcrR family transcriptional regulator